MHSACSLDGLVIGTVSYLLHSLDSAPALAENQPGVLRRVRATVRVLAEVHNSFTVEDSADLVAALNSIVNTCKNTQEQVKKVEQRIGALEQQQLMLSDTLKELHTMTLKQTKASFSVKDSSLGVVNLDIVHNTTADAGLVL